MFNNLVMVGLSLSVLLNILFWQERFGQPLFDESLTIIPSIQDGVSTFERKAWAAYTDIGFIAITAGPVLIPYLYIS